MRQIPTHILLTLLLVFVVIIGAAIINAQMAREHLDRTDRALAVAERWKAAAEQWQAIAKTNADQRDRALNNAEQWKAIAKRNAETNDSAIALANETINRLRVCHGITPALAAVVPRALGQP